MKIKTVFMENKPLAVKYLKQFTFYSYIHQDVSNFHLSYQWETKRFFHEVKPKQITHGEYRLYKFIVTLNSFDNKSKYLDFNIIGVCNNKKICEYPEKYRLTFGNDHIFFYDCTFFSCLETLSNKRKNSFKSICAYQSDDRVIDAKLVCTDDNWNTNNSFDIKLMSKLGSKIKYSNKFHHLPKKEGHVNFSYYTVFNTQSQDHSKYIYDSAMGNNYHITF